MIIADWLKLPYHTYTAPQLVHSTRVHLGAGAAYWEPAAGPAVEVDVEAAAGAAVDVEAEGATGAGAAA